MPPVSGGAFESRYSLKFINAETMAATACTVMKPQIKKVVIAHSVNISPVTPFPNIITRVYCKTKTLTSASARLIFLSIFTNSP